MPPSNNFHCVAKPLDCHDPDADPTVVRATIDRGGNLLVPWDWSGVFPPGQGSDPIARLVRAGQSGLEAFPAPDPRSGAGIIIPSAAYVSSHTLTGGVLPPFLDVGPPSGGGPFPGSVLVGTVDSLEGLLRIARNVGTDPAGEIFDLRSRLDGGVGPILINVAARARRAGSSTCVRSGPAAPSPLSRSPGNGPGTAGLLVYDNRNGRIGRVAEAAGSGELPRRVAVSDELAAFYDVETDLVTPDLTVLPVARLPAEGVDHATDVPTRDLIATGLFGSHGEPLPPSIGPSVVGGFAGPRAPAGALRPRDGRRRPRPSGRRRRPHRGAARHPPSPCAGALRGVRREARGARCRARRDMRSPSAIGRSFSSATATASARTAADTTPS